MPLLTVSFGLVVALLVSGCASTSGSPSPPARPESGVQPLSEPGPERTRRRADPSPPAQDSGAVVDRIVAVVNDEAITLTELLDSVAFFLYETRQPVPPSEEQALKRQVLQRMVEARLQLQEARREEITVTDEEVDERIAQVMERLGVETKEELERLVKAEGLTMKAVRKRFREQLMIQKVTARKVALRVSVTEPEIERYLRENREKLESGLSFQARHILIAPSTPATEAAWEEARAQADKIWGLIEDGRDFAELAMTYSQDASAQEGGDLGVLKQGELASEIETRVIRLEPGEVTAPFRTELGFHLFKLEWKDRLTGEALAQTKRQIREILFQQKFEARFRKWLERIKRRAVVEIRQ